MSLRILVDMNLSPEWLAALNQQGWAAVHWSAIGDPKAEDHAILAWARNNGHIVFTNDLDFGTLLALTHANGPSVVQARTQDLLPDRLGPSLFAALRQFESELLAGALLVIDETRNRVRILPL